VLRLKWFDYWLKGIDNGIMQEPPVRIFMMGDNKWRYEREWPPAQASMTNYYLRAGKAEPGAYSLNDGGLSTQSPAANEKADSFRYHPKEPLLTIGGDTRFGESGPLDQQSIEQRSLTYTTEALAEDLEVAGYPETTLFVSSTGVDTDFVVILTDVSPDGTSRILTRSLMRAKYYKTFEKAELLKPNQVYKLKIEMGPTGHVFKAGHRVRVSVSSSSYPAWIPNPNTGRDFNQAGPIRIVNNSVYHDGRQASLIALPVIPRSTELASAAK
jgi:putative CocE/NonD family hydrolase